MTKQTKANWLTLAIMLIFASFGLICHWKPAYGLIIGLSVGFTLATITIRASLIALLTK